MSKPPTKQSIRYLGSKRPIVPSIRQLLAQSWGDLSGWTLVDPFFGSGALCAGVIDMFGSAIVGDQEDYSYYVACAKFPPNAVQAIPHIPLCPEECGYVVREYAQKRQFWAPQHARSIDSARHWIRTLPSEERDEMIGRMLVAADGVANTMGTYASFIKKKPEFKLHKEFVLKHVDAWSTGTPFRPVKALLGDARVTAIDVPETSVLFLDPPYNHVTYSIHYAVLNVISRVFEEPVLREKKNFPEQTMWRRSAWNKRATAIAELYYIAQHTKARRMAISYSCEGDMDEFDIKDALKASGWTVNMQVIPHNRLRNFDSGDEVNCAQLVEYLFLATRYT